MIAHGILELIIVIYFFIPTVFFIGWNQLVGIIFIIVNLGCLKPNIIHPNFFCQLLYFFYLMFVWFHYQELKNNKWRPAIRLLFTSHNVLRTFQNFIQISANSVLLIYFLRC